MRRKIAYFAQRGDRERVFARIENENAVLCAARQNEVSVLILKSFDENFCIEQIVAVSFGRGQRRFLIPSLRAAPRLVVFIAHIDARVGAEFAQSEERLTARHVFHKRLDVRLPRNVRVNVGSRKIFEPGFAELFGRRRVRVPDNKIAAREKTEVRVRFEHARIRRPMLAHMRERFERHTAPAVNVSRHRRVGRVRSRESFEPEFPLRIIVLAPESQHVGLFKERGVPVPRAAVFGAPRNAALMAQPADRLVAICAERIGDRLHEVGDESVRVELAFRRKSTQNWEIGPNFIAAPLGEESVEPFAPVRVDAFPRDVVEIRKRLAGVGADRVKERAGRLVEVRFDCFGVENIDRARLADALGSEAQNLPCAVGNVPFELFAANLVGQIDDLGVARRILARILDRRPRGVELDRLASFGDRARYAHGERRDVLIIRLVFRRREIERDMFGPVDIPFRPDKLARPELLHIPGAA